MRSMFVEEIVNKQIVVELEDSSITMTDLILATIDKPRHPNLELDWEKLKRALFDESLIFALQAEALLKLRRHQDADNIMTKCPNFDVDECTKFFGPIGNANLLVTRAQVDMAAGRFEEALEAAQKAARLDSNNRQANKVLRKARAVTAARARGNELFKASKFSEACAAYEEGLENDTYNSVLLCNRAACRSKLGQLEKAVEAFGWRKEPLSAMEKSNTFDKVINPFEKGKNSVRMENEVH